MSILLLAAAAALPQPEACNKETGNFNPATLEYLRRVDTPVPPVNFKTAGYARIVADYSVCAINDQSRFGRNYDAERRDPIRRFFMRKQVSKVLTAQVSVRPLGVNGIATLVAIGRDSGKEGENWSTDVGNRLTLLPYFRVDPNMMLQLTANYESQRTYTSTLAHDVVDIVERASKLITPTTPLITASNKSRFNDASTFVDTTINGLLKVDIKENLRADSPLGRDAQPPKGATGDNPITLARLVLYATGTNDPYQRNPSEYLRPVGMWTIKVEPFSGSLFNGVEGTDTPAVASVLNFQVSDGKRVREMLAGDTIVSGARDAVLKPGAKKDLVGTLCRAVASRADAEGFSTEDVNWIVAAYIADMSPTSNPVSGLASGCPITSIDKMYAQEKAKAKAG